MAQRVDLRIILCTRRIRERDHFTPGRPLSVYSGTCLRSLDFVNAAVVCPPNGLTFACGLIRIIRGHLCEVHSITYRISVVTVMCKRLLRLLAHNACAKLHSVSRLLPCLITLSSRCTKLNLVLSSRDLSFGFHLERERERMSRNRPRYVVNEIQIVRVANKRLA